MYSVELCAGAGGQALGVEQAGFGHAALVEIDKWACQTLRLNRPHWQVIEDDLRAADYSSWKRIELLAGGLPCPPFSVAGKQLGEKDERNLFEIGLEIVEETRPHAVMFENVRGILDTVFDDYRARIAERLRRSGYTVSWRLLNASDFGVPQLRPRVVFVALPSGAAEHFKWPTPAPFDAPTVGEVLGPMMAAAGWRGAKQWAKRANDIAPTIVGGSKKHGGPDLGPTRAKKAWAALGVNGHLLADAPPPRDYVGMPILTVPMVARLQGFPEDWSFAGKKTNAYRQVGNAFPPPVAKAVAQQIKAALKAAVRKSVRVSKAA
ncbi:DNA cytosine methyltransferase [Ferrovibrio sp.]|uniref:DNA cytosine methyltransferase n=1 Tax=Ferrovibrio sp. TaxID=1917215 RepID=UPI0035B39803